jgi:hypothetical protein
VLDGGEYVGNNFGIFEYHADLVTINAASAAVAPSIKALGTGEFFWLGQNSQYVVLLSLKNDAVIRIPVTEIIISSVY